MSKTMKLNATLLRKAVITFLLLFLITFVARTAYELIFTGRDVTVTYDQNNYSNYELTTSGKTLNSNVASERISQQVDGQTIKIDQKYEKTANISSTSNRFAEDNAALRQIIEQKDAVIQSENLRGLAGKQTLEMTIGVMPDNFDAFVEEIQSIGEVRSFNVNKVDKTNEYRELMAQKETLQKSIDSYTEMKARGGEIKDLLLLEEKILETQEKIQNLGVSLGVYSSENSFCTIIFSMQETRISATEVDFSMRFVFSCISSAFFWTALFYFAAFICIIGALLGIWLILLIFLKIREQLADKPEPPLGIKNNQKKNLIDEEKNQISKD